MTKSSGVPAADLARANDRAEQLEADNTDLQAELDAARLAAAEPATTDTTTEDTTATDTTTDTEPAEDTTVAEEPQVEGRDYVVKSGDTLTQLAERFYGDASLDDYLAEVNDISDPTALSVGQTIFVPDEPPE